MIIRINRVHLILSVLMFISFLSKAQKDSLPKVLEHVPDSDFIAQHYRQLAAEAFQRQTIPRDKTAWLKQRTLLKQQIAEESGFQRFDGLPLAMKETGHVQQAGYAIKNIRFQTRPSVYATANLYVPEGKGPFPAVVITHGHWPDARRADLFQSVAQVLAKSGYVALTIDAWGTGERCTNVGEQEYHGANLGASLFNIGESLLGMQLTDNIRAVDLLCSLKEVDATKIGATGASGGGNQTMWLAAMDERIKAAIPVVSVGTFQSYIFNSNCVCELLPKGLTFTEESAVLGLIAPRALKIFSANQDTNPAFVPTEMLRSYRNAQPVFAMMNAKEKIAYQRFDTGHGYWPEMRDAMLGWFNLQLKGIGNGTATPAPDVSPLPAVRLVTYPDGQREAEVATTAAFCRAQGALQKIIPAKPKDSSWTESKRQSLKAIVGEIEERKIKDVEKLGQERGWNKMVLHTVAGQSIPFLWYPAKYKSQAFEVFIHSGGKDSIPLEAIRNAIEKGSNIVLLDLWGTGEQRSIEAKKIDGKLPAFHTLSRSAIWLGRTVMGEWVADLEAMNNWIQEQHPTHLAIQAYKETGVAALLFSVWNKVDSLRLYDCPYSYQFDQREDIDYYNMAIHLPGILNWGDVSLMKALSTAEVKFHHARSMSGQLIKK